MKRYIRNHHIPATRRLLAIALAAMLFVFPVMQVDAGEYTGSNVVTNNIHDHEYTSNSRVPNSYLYNNGDGTFTRVENMGDIILVERYNSAYKLAQQRTVGFELSIFGGFYAGQNYNYLIFGQQNMEQNDKVECIRIVRYSKDWVRLGSVAVTNCNTTIPFCGSGTDICENGNFLYIKTAHQTYMDKNGMYHQASMMITYQIDNNQVKAVQCGLPGSVYGVMENPAAQYIDATGGTITTVEHSPAPSGSMTVSRYNIVSSNGIPNHNYACSQVSPLSSVGSGATLGGYEVSGQYYLVAGSTGSLDGLSSNQNVFIAAVPKSSFSNSAVKLSFPTGYAYGELKTVGCPYLVKINSEQFVVIWETKSGYSELEEVSYVFINGAGQMTSEVKTMHGCLSDCQPIVFNNQVVWYVTNGAAMKIYTLPLSDNKPSGSGGQAVVITGGNIYQGVDYSAVFDFGYYISRYPDMRIFFANDQAGALRHFVTTGMAEGRQGCENFDVNIYRHNYPDLQAVFGNDLSRYYMHFITNGNVEGRNARTKIR